jgi:hypothetical protein
MAKGKKTGGKDFVKGQIANPNGRPPMTGSDRAIRELSKIEISRLLTQVSNMTVKEMQERWSNPTTPAIEQLFLKAILDGLSKGDAVKSAEFILNRTIGKVKDEVDVNFTPTVTVIKKSDGTQVHLGAKPKDEE